MNINAEGVDDSSEGAHALSQNSNTLKSQELSKGEQMNINTEGVDDSTEGAPALSRSYSLKSQPPRRRPRRRAESTMLLGEEIPLDPLVLLRIKRGQYGVCISSLIGVILFVSGNLLKSPLLNSISLEFAGIALFFFGTIFYENTSLVMIKRLMKSTKVIVIVMSGLCNLVIECIVPRRELSPAHAFVFVIIINAYVFLDAVITKSRYFVLGVGIIFFSLNIYNLLGNTIEDWNHGVVLFSYTSEGKEYSIMKRGTCPYMPMFSFKGIYTMFRDTTMKL